MTTLIAPRDLSFPNGPEVEAGQQVDIVDLAEALGRTDADVLAADLAEQGWTKPKKAAAVKKAAPKDSPAPAGDDNPPKGDDNKETP